MTASGRTRTFVLVSSLTIVLVACGGGGGGDSSNVVGSSSGTNNASSSGSSTGSTTSSGSSTGSTTSSGGSGSIGSGNVSGITGPWTLFNQSTYPPAVAASTTGKTYYVDGTNGSDSNTGLSAALAFRTISRTLPLVVAGDNVLIRKGLYREGIDMSNYASGSAGKPITFGAYGDGEVIVDGSTKVIWTLSGGTVSTAAVSFTPRAVVVNEVPLKQVSSAASVTSGSGNWYRGSGTITADLGTTSPSTADVVVPNTQEAQQHVYFAGQNYLTFKGLTIRGSGSNGIWGQGSHITVESCQIKFNGKAAVAFQGAGDTDNAVLTSHIYHNVLDNWPRGNNGYAASGGGWPGTLVWYANLRPVARGNIVHMNGGEGILSYGSANGVSSGYALFEQNMAYDNWSVNMYFDNQPYDTARNNFIFNHPPNTANFINGDASLAKYSVCLMLADEENSGDSGTNYAALDHTSVYNNILAGCRISIRDYSEGNAHAILYHGLKNSLIANNTIIMPASGSPYSSTNIYGIYLQDNTSPSGVNRNTNSIIENNIVYGFTGDPLIFSEVAGAISGVIVDYNDYYSSAGASPFGVGYNSITFGAFAWWQSKASVDTHSKYTNPLLVDATAFSATAATTPVYDYAKANVGTGSPAAAAGASLSSSFTVNFAGTSRSTWNMGAY